MLLNGRDLFGIHLAEDEITLALVLHVFFAVLTRGFTGVGRGVCGRGGGADDRPTLLRGNRLLCARGIRAWARGVDVRVR